MERFEQVDSAVANILRDLGNHLSRPLRVIDIIARLHPRLHVASAELSDGDGAMVSESGRAALYYRLLDPPPVQNFVLAHLLWHYIHHAKRGHLTVTHECKILETATSAEGLPALPLEEQQAHAFACALLLPREEVRAFIDANLKANRQQRVAAAQLLAERMGAPWTVVVSLLGPTQ